MEIVIKRFADNEDATMGILYINGIFNCFTIEDEERATKVKGETRVPNGTYGVALRSEGGFHNRYTKKYGEMHKGMLCIHNAPHWKIEKAGMTFQYILIHTGNTDDHTMGCLLLNDAVSRKTFTGSSSVDAYKRIYPKIAQAILDGEKVTIEYIDIEEGK
jgi:hypothetical protein|tara:strand:- start:117 stop:596 length:480 start_codon:yes stop_codon:yes gene_type:complete